MNATRDEDGELVVNPEGINAGSADPTDPDDISYVLQIWKQRVASCWTCETCDFYLSAEQSDGSNQTFHFLEHSGKPTE